MIKTEIRRLNGFDPKCPVPKFVKSAGLTHRFAVIQETYRADSVDTYFDQALCLHLLAFSKDFSPGSQIGILKHYRAKEEVRPDDFLAAWGALSDDDREPPAYILARNADKLVLCIQIEDWAHIGGPMPYHDSWTYSIFSNEDISDQVIKFLRKAEASQEWEIFPEILVPTREKIRMRWLWSKFLGA